MLERERGEYTDGSVVVTARVNHPDCVLAPPENPIFFVLFTGADLQSNRPSFWPRHFAMATAAAYAAKSRLAIRDTPLTEYAIEFKDAIEQATRSMIDPSQPPKPEYYAWLWANALSFVELADMRAIEPEVTEISRAGLRATAFGLAQVGATFDQKWRWSLPSGDTLPIPAAG